MRELDYNELFDRVFGCWLGKSIAGTIGAPFEGRKEWFSYEYDPRSIEKMFPNDDLDIQVIWLDVLERKGIYFTSIDLAEAFYEKYPFSPGEYAYFKKNYARGVMPPVSGWFNNRYYIDGMGCPIRSEIWACAAPGNMELAKQFSQLDGVLDHGENSVEGEIFLAALEAEAFFDHDLNSLIQKALGQINPNGKMHALLTDVIGWCGEYQNARQVRALILEKWGHADCTNLYQNMGITLLALLLGGGDFLKTTMLALNCGYDTDCTCATAGAVLGILSGAEQLMKTYGFSDPGYVLDAKVTRRSNTLFDLAEDTCAAAVTMAKYRNTVLTIKDCPELPELPHEQRTEPMELAADYLGLPAIGAGEAKNIAVTVKNNSGTDCSGTLCLLLPEGWTAEYEPEFTASAAETARVEITLHAAGDLLRERNLITAVAEGDSLRAQLTFGVAGAAVWSVYGPFWHNNSPIPDIPYWEPYGKYFDGVDDLRQYHLNGFADSSRAYVDEACFENIEKNQSDTCSMQPLQVNLYEDCFNLSDFITYQGSCVVYMLRELVTQVEETAVVNIGHSAPYKLWINGELVAQADECDWWTAENRHSQEVKLRKGSNQIVLKAARIGENGTFSLIFNTGLFTNQNYDYASLVPRKK